MWAKVEIELQIPEGLFHYSVLKVVLNLLQIDCMNAVANHIVYFTLHSTYCLPRLKQLCSITTNAFQVGECWNTSWNITIHNQYLFETVKKLLMFPFVTGLELGDDTINSILNEVGVLWKEEYDINVLTNH